jgi:hypothetical protein
MLYLKALCAAVTMPTYSVPAVDESKASPLPHAVHVYLDLASPMAVRTGRNLQVVGFRQLLQRHASRHLSGWYCVGRQHAGARRTARLAPILCTSHDESLGTDSISCVAPGV